MTSVRKCILKSISNHIEITLPHSKQVFVGRGPETEIVDTKLSKRQVSLVADVLACTVAVQCLGGNPSVADGVKLKKGARSKLNHKSRLELLAGKHTYQVEFSPIPFQDRITKLVDTPNKESTEKLDIEPETEIPNKKRKLNNNTELVRNSSCLVDSIWETIDKDKLLIYSMKGLKNSEKIASYDLDGTVIVTKSGKVFAVDKDDWTLFNPVVKSAFRKLFEDGFKIVIFTNQANISRGKTKVPDFKYKIENITRELGVPVQVFIATSEDKYRKPLPGMWDVLTQQKNGGLSLSQSDCFYVGDAAGRVVNWAPKKKKDFSCADRLFALNVGIKFQTPEAHFLKQPEGKYVLPSFNPSQLFSNDSVTDKDIVSKTQEVIVMVGSQGSGKSFFAKNYLVGAGYSYVNRDTLGSWQKCVSTMETSLRDGRSVVIDNTNPDAETRKRYVDVALKMKCPCRCFVMNTTIEHARHNNRFRRLIGDPHVPVNDIMISSYAKNFVPPTMDEGFTEIVAINFVPKFDDTGRERLYRLFLLEK